MARTERHIERVARALRKGADPDADQPWKAES